MNSVKKKNYIKNELEKYINNPHDKIVRDVLLEKREGITFLNNVLKLKEPLKIEKIENYTNSFVSTKLENKISDVVYKVVNENIYIVIEHQTKKDKSMKKRMLFYKMEVLRKLADELEDEEKLERKNYIDPTVIGIVLYTGKEKWNRKNNKIKSKKITMTLKKWKTQEMSNYELVNAQEIDEEKLLEENSMLSKVLLIERLKNIDEAKKLSEKIMKQEMTKEMRERINLYMIVLIAQNLKMPRAEVEKIIKNKKEVGKMQVDEMLQREARRLRREGRKEGIAVGKEKEKIKIREIIKNLILNNVQDEQIEKSINISNIELKQIKQELINQNA